MERLNQLELSKMVVAGLVTSAIATKKDGFYRIVLETPNKAFILKSQRDDVRLFKTLMSRSDPRSSISKTAMTGLS